MPHIDGRSGEIVIRIVYDGAPEAGKTTNVQQLLSLISLQRRGAAKSPGTTGARTEFFDWLDFTGGYLDGRRVRCQLVSVPGQPKLLHRRRYLLETADAVVFVADSRPASFEDSTHNLSTTLRMAERVAENVPIGVILQANKQDLADALSPSEVARALGMPKLIPVVGSVAMNGDGVMQTFVLAVRLATDRVRALLLENTLSDLPVVGETPEGLHASMLEIEVKVEAEAARLEKERAELARQEEARPTISRARCATGFSEELRRKNLRAASGLPPLPQAAEIASGHVWPPVKGRASIALATTGEIVVPDVVKPWAPADALELVSDGGWILHTSDRWLYADETVARRQLLTVVRGLLTRASVLPEGRSLAVARDREHWRLWLLTPRIPSIAENTIAAIQEGSMSHIATCLEQMRAAVRDLDALGLSGREVPAGIFGLGFIDGRLVLLSLDEGHDGRTLETRELDSDMAALVAEFAPEETALREWFESKGREIIRRAQSEPKGV